MNPTVSNDLHDDSAIADGLAGGLDDRGAVSTAASLLTLVQRSQLLAWARGGAAPAHASKSYIDELTLGHILELVTELNDKHWAAHWASELQGCGGGCGRGAILYSWLQSLGVQFFPGKFIKADFANLLRDLRRACRQQACSRPNLSLPARPFIESVLPKKMRPATPATSPTPSSPAESPSADSPADLIDLPTNLPATSTPSSNPPCADTLPGGPPTSSSPASSRLSLRLTIPVPEGTYISLRNANEKLQSEAQHLRMQEAELRLELRGEQGRHDETAEIADALRLRVAELISETERLQRVSAQPSPAPLHTPSHPLRVRTQWYKPGWVALGFPAPAPPAPPPSPPPPSPLLSLAQVIDSKGLQVAPLHATIAKLM